jgi:hypothetical protein
VRLGLFFCAAAALLLLAAQHRAPEYDEAYSIFLTAGHARPAWPQGVFTAGSVRGLYAGWAGFGRIARDLRAGDVHPPLYFWALEVWRQMAGPSWLAARGLSVLFSLGTLALLARLAVAAEVPVLPALGLTLLSYGFAYTGIVARGFALAQMLNMAGVLALFLAARLGGWRWALAGGVALGAASFTNYLAVFTGAAALLWLGGARWRALPVALAGFALFLPLDAWFFLAQRGSRLGQFTAFSVPHALALLGKDGGAAMFGGLPVYAGRFGAVAALALLGLGVAALACVARRRHARAGLFALLALAMPCGLLALGTVFHNTPIEIRYMAFAMPWVALLLAPALPRLLLGLMLGVQGAAIAGLIFAPMTMQPQGLAARAAAAYPGALVLVPFGNDGVGIPGPFIAAAPDDMRIELLRPGMEMPPGAVLANIQVDDASRAAVAGLGCAALVCRLPGAGGQADEQ